MAVKVLKGLERLFQDLAVKVSCVSIPSILGNGAEKLHFRPREEPKTKRVARSGRKLVRGRGRVGLIKVRCPSDGPPEMLHWGWGDSVSDWVWLP